MIKLSDCAQMLVKLYGLTTVTGPHGSLSVDSQVLFFFMNIDGLFALFRNYSEWESDGWAYLSVFVPDTVLSLMTIFCLYRKRHVNGTFRDRPKWYLQWPMLCCYAIVCCIIRSYFMTVRRPETDWIYFDLHIVVNIPQFYLLLKQKATPDKLPTVYYCLMVTCLVIVNDVYAETAGESGWTMLFRSRSFFELALLIVWYRKYISVQSFQESIKSFNDFYDII